MAYVYSKELTKVFDMKKISFEVRKFFNNYHLLCDCLKDYNIDNLTSKIKDVPISSKGGKTDSVWKAVKEITDIKEQLNNINKKIAYLKRKELTDSERLVFKYSIMNGELDEIVQDKVGLSYKTYQQTKKSCYIKVAIKFNLTKGLEKSIFKIMESLNSSIN